MIDIIYKLASLLLPVALGYLLKRIGFFGPKDYRIMAKIAINITLPAAVISSFSSFEMDLSYLFVPVIAFAANWIVLLFCFATTGHQKGRPKDRILTMLCASGFNMGNFLIPFVQQFMGSVGVALASIFDSGNSIMCIGGINIFTTGVIKTGGEKISFKSIVMKLAKSVPLVVYFCMIIMALIGWKVPQPIAAIVNTTGSANGFVSMFMIGLMIELRFDKKYMKMAAGVLGRKYLCGAGLALIVYFFLPLDLIVKQLLVMCFFTPIPSLAAVYTEQADGDVGLAGFVTAVSYLISCVIMVVLVMTMNMA